MKSGFSRRKAAPSFCRPDTPIVKTVQARRVSNTNKGGGYEEQSQGSLLAAMVAAVGIGHSPGLFAQTANASAAAESLAGTWEGKRDGVPSVVLRVAESGNTVQGEADFYLLKKAKADSGPPMNMGKTTAVMVNPHRQGTALAFQIVRANHNENPLNTTVFDFTLQPMGDRSAKLTRTGGGEDNLEVEMSRVE